jgi:selenocysteine-specific elongation factor
MDEVVDRVLAALGENETARPWAFGMTALGVARLLEIDERALVSLLAGPVAEGRLAYRSGYYATPSFVPKLGPEQRAFFDAVLAGDPQRPNAPVARGALAAAMRSAGLPGLDLAFDTLLASDALVPVGDDLYRNEQIAAIRAALERELRERGRVTVAQFRDAIGTSRKYAVPLLEFFDASGVTVRDGDNRFSPSSVPAAFAAD